MSALLQLVPRRDAVGRILVTNGAAAPDHFHNGLGYEANGDLAVANGGTIHHYHQGLPFSLTGRLITEAANPVYFGSGAAPFTATERLARGLGATPNRYNSGVAYSGTKRVVTD